MQVKARSKPAVIYYEWHDRATYGDGSQHHMRDRKNAKVKKDRKIEAYYATLEGNLSCFICHSGIQEGKYAV